MNDSLFEQIQEVAQYLNLDFGSQEMAQLAINRTLSDESIQTIADTFAYLKQKKSESIVSTLLRLSRLPLKEPKTFDRFQPASWKAGRCPQKSTIIVCALRT